MPRSAGNRSTPRSIVFRGATYARSTSELLRSRRMSCSGLGRLRYRGYEGDDRKVVCRLDRAAGSRCRIPEGEKLRPRRGLSGREEGRPADVLYGRPVWAASQRQGLRRAGNPGRHSGRRLAKPNAERLRTKLGTPTTSVPRGTPVTRRQACSKSPAAPRSPRLPRSRRFTTRSAASARPKSRRRNGRTHGMPQSTA